MQLILGNSFNSCILQPSGQRFRFIRKLKIRTGASSCEHFLRSSARISFSLFVLSVRTVLSTRLEFRTSQPIGASQLRQLVPCCWEIESGFGRKCLNSFSSSLEEEFLRTQCTIIIGLRHDLISPEFVKDLAFLAVETRGREFNRCKQFMTLVYNTLKTILV